MGLLRGFYENMTNLSELKCVSMILKRQLCILHVAEGRRGITIACCESLNKMDCKTCHEIAGKKLDDETKSCVHRCNVVYCSIFIDDV